MRALVTAASAAVVLLLATGSASYGSLPRAEAPAAAPPCTGQINPDPSFERGAPGWTAGPRMIVLGDETRPARTGRAYATFGGLDVTRTDLLRTTVTVPANCTFTFSFWVRTTSTETMRRDYFNIGLNITGTPPKTLFALAGDGPRYWYRYTSSAAGSATTERTAIITFFASEAAGEGVSSWDLDDVRFTLS